MGFRHSSVMDSGYRASLFDASQAIADVMKIVVTTPATGSYWLAHDVVSHQTVNVTLTEDVTIGSAGTAMVFYARNRQGDHPDDCACLIEQGGTYTGGTEILTKVELRAESGNHTLLKQGTSYLISVTSKGADNYTSAVVWVWQGSGTEG